MASCLALPQQDVQNVNTMSAQTATQIAALGVIANLRGALAAKDAELANRDYQLAEISGKLAREKYDHQYVTDQLLDITAKRADAVQQVERLQKQLKHAGEVTDSLLAERADQGRRLEETLDQLSHAKSEHEGTIQQVGDLHKQVKYFEEVATHAHKDKDLEEELAQKDEQLAKNEEIIDSLREREEALLSVCLNSAQELARFQDAHACKVCLAEPADHFFWPCRHLVTCSNCAPSLERCPICRSVGKVCKMYLS